MSYDIIKLMVKEKIRRTILQHGMIHEGDHIIIGLSGGPDSVCLFHVLKDLSREMKFYLYAVHVNHKFRPRAAEEDQHYVEELCQREQIPCRCVVRDCNALMRETGMSGEEAGRKARYEAFEEMAENLEKCGKARGTIKIAVAQNADDQAETVLLRLLRGTGPDGLAGMDYLRKQGGYQIIRPLLDIWREEIEEFCLCRELNPRRDHTNTQPIYTRNKIRLGLLPYLRQEFNPNISHALIRLSRIAAQDKAYLWAQAEKEYQRLCAEDGALGREQLKGLESPIRHRVIMRALEAAGLTQDISEIHLAAADQLLEEKGGAKTLDLPRGYVMSVRYGQVRFYKKKDAEETHPAFKLRSRIEVPPEERRVGAFFDWDKIVAVHGASAQVVLRNRMPGDYIRIKQGRKKIQDFFIDQKIPKEERDVIPLAAIGREILWICAADGRYLKKDRYSEKYKLDQTTKKALVLEIICDI